MAWASCSDLANGLRLPEGENYIEVQWRNPNARKWQTICAASIFVVPSGAPIESSTCIERPSASAFLQLFSKSRTELATRPWCNFPLEGDRNCGVRPRAWYSTLPKMVRSEGPSASRLFPAGG